jgi:hypothetical protein
MFHVLNDATVELLAKTTLSHAQATPAWLLQ